MENLTKTKRHKIASKTVRTVIHAMPEGHKFFGWELKNECVKLQPELCSMYTDSFLRALRNCKKQYVCIDRQESLYMKVGSDDGSNN